MVKPLSASPKPSVISISLFLLVLAISIAPASAQNPPQPPSAQNPAAASGASGPKFDITTEAPGNKFTFIGYGDTRFMDPSDTRHSNAAARTAIVEKMAKDKPFFIAISGDLVYEGSNVQEWLQFDRETKVWRDQKIKLFPALGNHDVRGGLAAAMPNYFQRFPLIDSKRWYSVRIGNVALLVLDSTDDATENQQSKWLDDNLSAMPNDIDFVMVVLHHPPYTESTDHMLGGGHEARKREQVLGRMIEEHQAKMRAKIIVLAGHVHNYERYVRGGVTYIVSGGGGATPYLIKRKPDDFYTDGGPTYHYCKFQVDGAHLKGEMFKYIDANDFQLKDSFELSAK